MCSVSCLIDSRDARRSARLAPMERSLPPGFADQLARLIEPADQEAAARVLAEAAELDERRLAGFLERLAARLRSAPDPLTAGELRRLLAE